MSSWGGVRRGIAEREADRKEGQAGGDAEGGGCKGESLEPRGRGAQVACLKHRCAHSLTQLTTLAALYNLPHHLTHWLNPLTLKLPTSAQPLRPHFAGGGT